MPAVYVYLSGRDVDDAILKANGFTKPESSPTLAPRENTACQVDNIETLVEDKLRIDLTKESLQFYLHIRINMYASEMEKMMVNSIINLLTLNCFRIYLIISIFSLHFK